MTSMQRVANGSSRVLAWLTPAARSARAWLLAAAVYVAAYSLALLVIGDNDARWSLAGRHRGDGLWGAASGREILIMAVSHYRLRGGSIVEDVTVFDELAVLRQIAGGLGA